MAKKHRKVNKKHLAIVASLLVIAIIFLIVVINNFKKAVEVKKEEIEQQIEVDNEKQREEQLAKYVDGGTICIAVGAKQEIGNNCSSEDENIAKIDNGNLVGVSNGEVIIYNDDTQTRYEVSVSDLYLPAHIDNNKELLPCGQYSNEQAIYLDTVLESKVMNAGYKTRAGVLAAARFLALEFKYRMPYFYENGRLEGSTGHPYADGEGRFYHKGLYLSEEKYDVLDPNGFVSGPQIWGCEMFSGAGGVIPNGLDCSGYVSWCLYQAGFDPGDVGGGAGIWDGAYNLPDLGVGDGGAISTSSIDPDAIQAGDIIAWEGTIAIVVGVDEENIYVAHQYWDNDLEVVTTPKSNLANSEWEYVTLMDNYYNEEGNGAGNYTAMWN
ncbi:MAG: hypothetical protein Q4E33_00835 [Erysipelotrichaceae bacterium]|nr:hypothetical protein [Erysipelotrichaceae bacterium]